jgi:cation diffusion facilitator CzcD-associated flavoprotein CzcO
VAEDILASGDADLIAIGRGLIAEPEWVQKVQGGKERLMRKCISCNIGCADHRIARSRPLRCSINPDIIHGDAYKMRRVNRETNVVVIGAGTAGMEAACTAAEVGCHTWLLEAKNHVGGLASEISRLPEKKRIADFPQFMKNRIASLDNLMLQVGKRADVASVSALRPHLIVNATGSTPLLPPIEGLRENIDVANGKVFSITGMIDNLAKFTDIEGKRIAVVGAGAVGLDVIEYFTARGAQAVLNRNAGRRRSRSRHHYQKCHVDHARRAPGRTAHEYPTDGGRCRPFPGEKYTANLRYPLRLRLCLSGDARQPDGSRRDRALGQCQ